MSEEEVDADIIQVYSGDRGSNEDPVHFLLLQDEFPEHTNRAMEAASHGIESTVWPYGPDLVRLFFRHIHPVYPIVSKVRFLRQYIRAKEEIPTSLRGAIYALACVFWNCDPSLRNRRSFVQHELLDHAHSALRRELESPSLFKLQACLLLLHLRPPEIDSVETPSTWILTSQAVACAQMMGLHRDPRPWNIVSSEKKLRKKLWWATYVTDCWSSISHGNPPHISADSFDTSPLDMEDVRFDEDVPDDLSSLVDSSDTSFRVVDGARFMKTVEIAQCLRTVLDCSFQIKPTRDPTIPSPKAQLIRARHTLVDWLNLLPQALGVGSAGGPLNLHNNIPLHLSYYAAQVLLFRALMHPATKEARVDPESNLRQWFSAALDEFKSFTTFMDSLCGDDLGCFWPRHTRSQLILCGNFLIYMFLLAYTPHDIEAAYRLLESFQQSLQRLETAESIDGRLVLRPVTLRINSFFAQASDLLKGASSSSTSIGVNVNTPMTPM
ncbi:hypothetical protein EYZ11_004693 [Aspergillus tanneri]|nr:hypothetical protein EYZ11_004693 [Aspergillus tanneri]